ncbi:MAG TPA: twin-arginine translocase subunit TatC [Firmicutes bacterium]|nr:twin-arginine translocase subunit TatC [Bacillota bacterium]
MHIFEHLAEVRRRLLFTLAVFTAAALFSYLFVDRIRASLAAPAGELVYLGVTEAFLLNVRLALYSGCFLTLPFAIYHFWSFILPALRRRERFYVTLATFLSLLCFFLGAAFAFFVILPFTVRFFLGFASESLQPMLTFSSYLAFSSGIIFGFGLLFELPVVVLILARLGIISAAFLRAHRKYAIVIIFIVAAFLTPPDVFSQLLMGIPLAVLYEVSILLAALVSRRSGT